MFDWLTPEIRKAIYGLATIALTFAIAYGLVTAEQIELSIGYISQAVTALVTLMAFLNTHIES
jgi:hypothetical protein